MKTAKRVAIGVACLTAGMMWFGSSALATERVTKPLKFHGHNIIKVDRWSPCFAWVIVDEGGEMTHVGRYACQGGGIVTPMGIVGSGILTTASGDTLFWQATGNNVTLTGLSGRFAGAIGSFEATRTVTNVEFSPDARFQIVTYSQTGVGTIAY